MGQIDLREYEKSEPLPLSVAERDGLREILSLAIERADTASAEAEYHLTPGSTVGAVEIGDLSVLIRPKIGIRQLLSLACYATDAYRPQKGLFDFEQDETLPDTLALALANASRRAFAQGLLHGYRTEEETLHTVRGRVRFDEQMRRRFNIVPPVEVRYDEFTDDILANRLVKAAAARLGGMRLRSGAARRGLGWAVGVLDNVSLVELPPRDVPEVRFDQLNEHYRDVVGLSRLILRHSAFESGRGEMRASGFLMDMNVVFQEFVTQALRESLRVSDRVFCSGDGMPRRITLDEAGRVRLEPDLSWWDGSVCTFVGDAKYKNITGERVPNADLYQLLAYATALDLPSGMLIYAQGEADTATHHVRLSGKRLDVLALDLSGTLDDALNRVKSIARTIKVSRDEARGLPHTAEAPLTHG